MKRLKILTIILIVLILISATICIILACIHSSNKGSIEGTGFIIQELDGAGGVRYDVDDHGNIYFVVNTFIWQGITVYDEKGEYMYTLPNYSVGAIRVKIDQDNNILVYDVRKKLVAQYNNMGIRIGAIQDEDYSLGDSFPWKGDQNVRERNGIRYVNNNGTITKIENGVETVVFTVPVWQRWYRAFNLTLTLSCVAMFLRVAIPLWIRTFKDRYGKRTNSD